jgi:hypothetical protein
MTTLTPSVGNLSVQDVYTTVVQKGLTESQANAFVGEWLLVNAGKAKRVFSYSQAFDAVDADCKSSFARSFVHDDWIDGESVVQASETPGESGFNRRFHRIETDLDSLGANAALAFTCLAEMRQQMKNLLEEIRVELNRINSDLDGRSSSSPFTVNPNLVQASSFLGKFKINEQSMQLWNTGNSMVMLPDLQTVAAPLWSDPRAQRAATLSKYIEDNAQVRATFPQAVTKKDFIEKFGNDKLEDGSFVRDLVSMLPEEGAAYGSLDAMSADVTSRETSALRTTPGVKDAAALALGISTEGGKLDAAAIEQFNALPAQARSALARSGITTVGQLAGLSTERVAEVFKNEQVKDVSRGDIASALTVAKSIVQL